MANRRTLEEQIEQALKELKQKEARIKELKQRQRSRSDKTRTHRLCKRGGLVESLLPRLAKFTDEQFETWVKKILMSENSLRLIDQLLPPAPDGAEPETIPSQEEITAEPETANAPQQAPAPPPAETANAPSYERSNSNQQRSNNPNHNGNPNANKPNYQHNNNRQHNSGNANHNNRRNY